MQVLAFENLHFGTIFSDATLLMTASFDKKPSHE